MDINKNTITGSIYLYIFKLLEENPEGMQWKDLDTAVREKFPDFHPKTINGCIWQLTSRFSDKIHKPERGRFALLPDANHQ